MAKEPAVPTRSSVSGFQLGVAGGTGQEMRGRQESEVGVTVGWLWLSSAFSTQLHVSPAHVIFPAPTLDLSGRGEGWVTRPIVISLALSFVFSLHLCK